MRRAVVLLLLGSLLLAGGCGRGRAESTAPPPAPLLVLGIDGASRTLIDPLMKQGRLPNFQRLAQRGLFVDLETREPTISPIIWTSIATGKVPEKHGIHGFTAPIPDTEKVSVIRLPQGTVGLKLTGAAPPQVKEQSVEITAAGGKLGSFELSLRPGTHEVELPEGTAEVTLTFGRSARKEPRSPFWVTAWLKVEALGSGGAVTELTPAFGVERVYDTPVRRGGQSYLQFGGDQQVVTVSSNMRRVKALWNILSERDRTVMIAGYWVTWPAEKVNGAMISSYTSARYGFSKKGTFLRDFPDQTYPETLTTDLQPLLEEAIARGRRRAEQAAARFGVKLRPLPAGQLKPVNRRVVAGNGTPPPEKDPRDPAEQLVWIATSDAFYTLAGVKLIPELRPDLSIVYLGEVDVVGHDWWDYEPDVKEGVIAQAYERADAALGELLAALGNDGRDYNIVVISDHGFAFDEHGVFEHQFTHPPGILLAAGPGIQPGAKPVQPGVLDIPPTLLALLDLPMARDMDGRVLAEMLRRPAPEPIATYETGPPREPELPIPSPIDEKVQDQLRDLGYIE